MPQGRRSSVAEPFSHHVRDSWPCTNYPCGTELAEDFTSLRSGMRQGGNIAATRGGFDADPSIPMSFSKCQPPGSTAYEEDPAWVHPVDDRWFLAAGGSNRAYSDRPRMIRNKYVRQRNLRGPTMWANQIHVYGARTPAEAWRAPVHIELPTRHTGSLRLCLRHILKVVGCYTSSAITVTCRAVSVPLVSCPRSTTCGTELTHTRCLGTYEIDERPRIYVLKMR